MGISAWFSNSGVELELGALLLTCVLGSSIFDRFEVETAIWKKLARWGFAVSATLGAFAMVGHWSLLLLALFSTIGIAVHFIWCSKNGINPVNANPRQLYYEKRGWQWPPR